MGQFQNVLWRKCTYYAEITSTMGEKLHLAMAKIMRDGETLVEAIANGGS